MKAVILCGGQGTRIRDANEVLPKPLLPIGGKPIVWHIMKGYATHGIRDFVLCLGYKGWLIKEFFLNYRPMTTVGSSTEDTTKKIGVSRLPRLEKRPKRGVGCSPYNSMSIPTIFSPSRTA